MQRSKPHRPTIALCWRPSAVNALGANQREHALRLGGVEARLDGVEGRLTSLETRVDAGFQESNARFRSVDEQLAEIKDLILGRNGG